LLDDEKSLGLETWVERRALREEIELKMKKRTDKAKARAEFMFDIKGQSDSMSK